MMNLPTLSIRFHVEDDGGEEEEAGEYVDRHQVHHQPEMID